MNEKEEKVLKTIYNFYNENYIMPSYRYLQKCLNYKSINSIRQYMKSLECKGYLKRNNLNRLIISNNSIYYNNFRRIKIINRKNRYIDIFLNKNKEYLGYQITNNIFQNMSILKNDILIFEKNKHLHNNDIGLFIIDNKYRIMKYNFKDGFFLLRDNETLFLNKVIIIGKLVQMERIIKKL